MDLKIIDNFFSGENFNLFLTAAMLNPYKQVWQPGRKNLNSRLHAYPCHETVHFVDQDNLTSIFLKTFFEKTGLKITRFTTFFRKTYAEEIQHIFKYGQPPHQDPKEFRYAGVIYYNSYGLEDGTGIFSEVTEGDYQIQPDIIIGAKPNRCVFYDPQIWHLPLQDKNNKIRIIQPFFINIENNEHNKKI